ncbi:MAG: type I-D CRISPR-associated helicase Cas3' [Chloroflexota bacterium]|nr:type I-D CRISPR-associated helicase Cas3' [Chloroflexota bacterium]
MLTVTLEPQYERIWLGENPAPATFPLGQPPLLHQWRTYSAEQPLIVNTYNTGTGKTKASLLRLLKRARDKGVHRLDSTEDNALLIAPTNELLAQHARDVEQFCNENAKDLPYRVVAVSRASLDSYKLQEDFSETDMRRGAALHYIMQNSRRLDADSRKKATLYVVNPDIFYYALYSCYGRNDRIPLFQDILTLCNFIIIDEFHYYDAKQFANFLFFMRLSQHYGFSGRQFCLLTATPNQRVREYLERLFKKEDIAWIMPDSEEGFAHTEKAQALAEVTLEVYNEQDLRDGLLTLVDEKRASIKAWLKGGDDGAVISGALWRINQVYDMLRSSISPGEMGRLTGAETHTGREEARHKRLILATPTVDIGYNFDRPDKPRQNIDFLLLDARSSDELIQRLGRAGRVLSKQIKHIPGRVLAVVNQQCYEALKPFAGQRMHRTQFRELVGEAMPARHILYAYIQSGAIAEAFLPIYRLERMESEAGKPDIEQLYNGVKDLFAPAATFTYKQMRRMIHDYTERDRYYSRMDTFPADPTDCLKQCQQRLEAQQDKGTRWKNMYAAFDWLQKDLREYFTEKARFSFRESFQPPLALVSDANGLLSSAPTTVYEALHIAKNYRAHFFKTRQDWQKQTGLPLPERAGEALVFCDLTAHRKPEERLQIGLKLDASGYQKLAWEEQFVYRSREYVPTALYGLEVVGRNSSRALDDQVRTMFQERYIPAFLAREGSRTASQLWNLRRQGQIQCYQLSVTFADGYIGTYDAVLGTLALLAWAEVLFIYRKMDEQKAQSEDDHPLIY